MSAWDLLFAWPSGGVWSNLIASVLWVAPAFAWHHKRMVRHVQGLHQRLDAIEGRDTP